MAPDETQFQKSVTDLADQLGVFWYFNPDSRRCTPGFPDLVLTGTRGTLFRENKVPPNDLSAEQQAWGDRLLGGGEDWAVWTPADMQSGRILKELQAIR